MFNSVSYTPEIFELMWLTPLFGMAMIFSVLTILWAVLSVFKLIFVKSTPTEEKRAKPVVQETTPVVVEPVVDKTDDGELVAVITAAVAAYMAEQGDNTVVTGFRVVSFRRTNTSKAWNVK